jgi:hypothetical protein
MIRRASRPVLLACAVLAAGRGARAAAPPDNPAIDMPGFLRAAEEAARQRDTHRVDEEEFLRLSREAGTVVLDARSREKYDLLHVAGAVNLPFPDITVDSLALLLPDRGTRILIYCNNNFANAPDPFPSKIAIASLNLSTYVALWSYGYRDVYELAPQVDLARSKLAFESTAKPAAAAPAADLSPGESNRR